MTENTYILYEVTQANAFEWRENLAVTHTDGGNDGAPWYLTHNQAQLRNEGRPLTLSLDVRLANHPVNVGPLLEMLWAALPGYEISLRQEEGPYTEWVVRYNKDLHEGVAKGTSPVFAHLLKGGLPAGRIYEIYGPTKKPILSEEYFQEEDTTLPKPENQK